MSDISDLTAVIRAQTKILDDQVESRKELRQDFNNLADAIMDPNDGLIVEVNNTKQRVSVIETERGKLKSWLWRIAGAIVTVFVLGIIAVVVKNGS